LKIYKYTFHADRKQGVQVSDTTVFNSYS